MTDKTDLRNRQHEFHKEKQSESRSLFISSWSCSSHDGRASNHQHQDIPSFIIIHNTSIHALPKPSNQIFLLICFFRRCKVCYEELSTRLGGVLVGCERELVRVQLRGVIYPLSLPEAEPSCFSWFILSETAPRPPETRSEMESEPGTLPLACSLLASLEASAD